MRLWIAVISRGAVTDAPTARAGDVEVTFAAGADAAIQGVETLGVQNARPSARSLGQHTNSGAAEFAIKQAAAPRSCLAVIKTERATNHREAAVHVERLGQVTIMGAIVNADSVQNRAGVGLNQ